MPTAHTCLVSFTDTNNIRHAVEVAASTLYEAATPAMAEFRRCGFTENAPGPATRLTVTVKGPSTSHEVQWGKVETWIQSAGKPNEQAMKGGCGSCCAGDIGCATRIRCDKTGRMKLDGRICTLAGKFILVSMVFTVPALIFPADKHAEASHDWLVTFRENLQQNLRFWVDHAGDREYGGLLGRLDRTGKPVPPGDKSVVLISRSLWSFSEAYRRYPDLAYRRMADECLKFLREKMWDKQQGGYYFSVTREGKVIDATKQLNPMSYVLEGLAEYALAFHDQQAYQEALDLFDVIDRNAHDNEFGGYRIAFTQDWHWLKDYKDGPNAAGSFGRKSYDWHLGLVEALATLYDVTGEPRVRARLNELLDIFANKIIDPDKGYGRYYFTQDWKVADHDGDSRDCEYGLDLEASWLLTEAAERLGRNQDTKIRRASLALVDHALRDGFDKEHGGIYRTGPPDGPAANRDMEWWQQAEALVAFLNAYQYTGDPKYWHSFEIEAQFVMSRFADHEYGEWYTAISRDGQVDTEKVGPWKAPYHMTRACLEVISRLGRTL